MEQLITVPSTELPTGDWSGPRPSFSPQQPVDKTTQTLRVLYHFLRNPNASPPEQLEIRLHLLVFGVRSLEVLVPVSQRAPARFRQPQHRVVYCPGEVIPQM